MSLGDILENTLPRLEDTGHAHCDTSCPDCLRSYENRRLHGVLDWRLALDLTELAAGKPLSLNRWLDRGQHLSHTFVQAFSSAVACSAMNTGDLWAIVADDHTRAVLLGHPLWSKDPQVWSSVQARAHRHVSRLGVQHAWFTDMFVLARFPAKVFGLLQKGIAS
jgi:DEAD/DEAH box helicase domain-containing protein